MILFDFHTKTKHVLLEWPREAGILYRLSVSPTGEHVAFLVRTKTTSEKFTYIFRLFDLNTQTVTDLISGSFGISDPVWSPDGSAIAFAWSAPETFADTFIVFPVAEEWLGNIWVVSVETGRVRQVTQIQGAARRPVWSLDGSSLSFFTHDGQFGMTRLDEPSAAWQLTGPLASGSRWASLVYLP